MKCAHCGHKIGIEDVKCPYCGGENKTALQHEQNLAQFEQEFGTSEKEMERAAGRLEGLGKRAVILVVLLIGILIMALISVYNFVPKQMDEDAQRIQDAIQNYEQYSGQMDEYLKQGEYMEYITFVYSHCIYRMEANETYWRYHYFNEAAERYYDVVKETEEIVLRSEKEDYDYPLDMRIDHLGSDIGSFYETFEEVQKEDLDEDIREYLRGMEAQIRTLIRTYLGMDDGQLEEFLTLSDTQKAIRLEEVLKHE